MNKYQVGGSVRDEIMGLTPRDFDYVVVGSTENEMIQLGYTKVGKDFPVFIDFDGNEIALARKEKKTGVGYTGFSFEVDNVTLKEDTLRRDLTINSIAKDIETGEYIDYHNGISDIENKILRHTSEAFLEDPVRVLRIARFMSRYGSEWSIAKETKELIFKAGKKGLLGELQKDRIWKEMEKVLDEKYPHLFFRSLYECDVLHYIFPDIYKLKTATESLFWHPEGDAFEHTMLVLEQSAMNDFGSLTNFCALVHDIGKGLTHRDKLPSHYGHDVKGAEFLEGFCEKYAIPNKYKNVSKYVTRYHMYGHKLLSLNPKTIVNMLDDCRCSEIYTKSLYEVFICDERGRKGSEKNDIGFLNVFNEYVEAYKSIKFSDFPEIANEKNGEKIKDFLHKKRINAVAEVKKRY